MCICKKILAVLLSVLLICGICLVGCAKEEPAPAVSYAELMNMMNQTISSDLGQVVGSPMGWTVHEGRLWVVGHQPGEVDDPTQRELWVANAGSDGTNVTAMQLTGDFDPKLEKEKETLANENPDIAYALSRALTAVLFDSAQQPHFFLYEVLTSQTPEADYPETVKLQFSLCRAGTDGVLQRDALLQFPEGLDTTSLFPSWYYLADDTALWIYVSGLIDGETAGVLLRFAIQDGSCTARFDVTGLSAPKSMPDGSLLIVAPGSETNYSFYTLTRLVAETPTFQETAPIKSSEQIRGFVQPLDDEPVEEILLWSTNGVLRYDMAAGKAEPLLQWDEYGVLDSGATRALYYYLKGATTQLLRIDGENNLNVLSVIDQAALEVLPTITVGLYSTENNDKYIAAVHAYNAAGNDYYFKTVVYDDREQLMQDIATHKGPDILLSGSGIDYDGLVRKGYFADLYPYLDADPQLNRDDFLPNILKATEFDGTLPTIIGSFQASTVVASSELVGTDMGWTLDEYAALVAQYPDARAFFDLRRDIALEYMLYSAGDQFIDRQTGKVSFDSPAFIQLLEMTADYSTSSLMNEIFAQTAKINWDDPDAPQQHAAIYDQLNPKSALDSRQVLLNADDLYGFWNILTHEYEFDGPVTYIGYPTTEGKAGARISLDARFGISSTCASLDVAWGFMRTFLLPSWQDALAADNTQYRFPVRKDSLQVMADAAMRPVANIDEEWWRLPEYLDNNATDEQKAYFSQGLTQAQVDQVMDMLYSANIAFNHDAQLEDIIFEEANYFYGGARTAAEAAAIIQDRVQTYLDEQG